MKTLLPTAKLGEIAEINPKLDEPLESDTPVSFVPMAAVSAETASVTNGEERCFHEVSKGYTPFLEGDVLVAKITPCFENGKIAQATLVHRVGFGSTEFHVIRPHPHQADARYLLHFLRQDRIRREGERKMTGSAGQRRVPGHFLAGLEIPLPPLPEQQRIAEVLDRVEGLRARRRAALAQLDTLTQAIFLDMFGDQHRIPTLPLEALCELITDGTHYTPEYAEAGVVFLSARNVTSGYIDWENVKFIPESLHRELQKRIAPRRNDILLAKNGTTGVAAIVDRDCVFDIYVSLALLRAREGVLPAYLHGAVNSPVSGKQFKASLKGIGVPNLHLKEIRQVRIPNPPLALQREFARRVAAVEKLKAAHRASLAEMDALFASLQQRAFRGEL